jgi:hypothetical protein
MVRKPLGYRLAFGKITIKLPSRAEKETGPHKGGIGNFAKQNFLFHLYGEQRHAK